MAAVNKRQQARNERALQDLIRSVPGNERCADCFNRNPGWASWSLGCFLCMRCAAIHRKIGVHVTKVKSLSMDAWTNDQVENMKRNGNVVVNRIYNPRNIKPVIPVDTEEVDGIIERYIRSKYQHRNLGSSSSPAAASTTDSRQPVAFGAAVRHDTGSAASDSDDTPPAVPAKDNPPPKKRFGLGRMSKIPEAMHITSRKKSSSTTDLDDKLKQLQDMGFSDESRNVAVLRGLGGDLGRAVDALVRLGEGGSAARTSAQRTSSRQPAAPKAETVNQSQQQRSATLPVSSTNTNPWTPDQSSQASIDSPAALSPQTTSTRNPFYAQSSLSAQHISAIPPQPAYHHQQQQQQQQQQPAFEQMFQNMSVSGQSFQQQSSPPPQLFQQPPQLFAQSTGSNNPFVKSFTPPMTPQSFHSFDTTHQQPLHAQPTGVPIQQMQPLQPQHTSNPFLRTSRSQNFATTNPFGQSTYGSSIASMYQPQPQMPFAAPAPSQSPSYQQQQHPMNAQTAQQLFGGGGIQSSQRSATMPVQGTTAQSPLGGHVFGNTPSPFAQSPAPLDAASTYFGAQSQSPSGSYSSQQAQGGFQQAQYSQQQATPQQPVPQQAQYMQQQQPQPQYIQQQPTGRADKASIMALFNAPHMAPHRPATIPEDQSADAAQYHHQQYQQQQQQQQQQQPQTAPASNNPFAHLQQRPQHSNNDAALFAALSARV